MGEVDVLDIIGNVSWIDDKREPLGPCRWCGKNDNSDGEGFALIRQDGQEWYECGPCCWAIGNYGLQSDDVDAYDVDAIMLRRLEAPGAP